MRGSDGWTERLERGEKKRNRHKGGNKIIVSEVERKREAEI